MATFGISKEDCCKIKILFWKSYKRNGNYVEIMFAF